MKILQALLIGAVLVAVAGCTVKVRPPIEIEVDGGGKHCPPGQAKKGRC